MTKENKINPAEKAMGYLKWRIKVAIVGTIVFLIGYLIYSFIK